MVVIGGSGASRKLYKATDPAGLVCIPHMLRVTGGTAALDPEYESHTLWMVELKDGKI